MRRIAIVLLLLTLAIPVFSQQSFQWRWANTVWYGDDKGFHCFGSAYLCNALDKKQSFAWSATATILLGTAWEVKDAFLPYEHFGWFGGDGFDQKDLAADIVGIGLTYLVNHVFWHRYKKDTLELLIKQQNKK